jgi:quercetin dioxygenase-like cupin family protein
MNKATGRRAVAIAGALLTVVAVVAAQQQSLKRVLAQPTELTFVKMENGTLQATVVGDMSRPGPYAARTKLPAGLRIPPHFHPEARIVLVMSGTLYVGYGDRFDEARLTALPAGSVFTEPEKEPHFTWARDGDVLLHVTGVGPTGTTWIGQKE